MHNHLELAAQLGDVKEAIDYLVLDPAGPLHDEPDRLIAEELPPANEVRPLLDAIGDGAHRVSEIAGRIGRPATSLSRPLQRIQGMGLVQREVPFGASEKGSKRSLYRIADPFTRLWFRVVAPNRALLATSTAAARSALLETHWPQLRGEAWEDLCRQLLPTLHANTELGGLGPWGPASRWWHGNAPEWDLVSVSLEGQRLLVGEVKSAVRSVETAQRELEAKQLAVNKVPTEVVRALFVIERPPKTHNDTVIVQPADLLGVDD